MLAAFKEVLIELRDFALLRDQVARTPVRLLPEPKAHDEALVIAYTEKVSKAANNAGLDDVSLQNVSRKQLSGIPSSYEHAFIMVQVAQVFQRPTRALDTVISKLPFGTRVTLHGRQGRWAEVLYGETRGWISRDELTDQEETVLPKFECGIIYDSLHPDTEKVRRYIGDEFAAQELSLPLLNIEYVQYRLCLAGRKIPWSSERPRLAGMWRERLRGARGVHVGVVPTTDSVMEVIGEDGVGHVLYVEAVRPDESIEVSDVGFEIEGRFDKRCLRKESWQALRPVFIEIT